MCCRSQAFRHSIKEPVGGQVPSHEWLPPTSRRHVSLEDGPPVAGRLSGGRELRNDRCQNMRPSLQSSPLVHGLLHPPTPRARRTVNIRVEAMGRCHVQDLGHGVSAPCLSKDGLRVVIHRLRTVHIHNVPLCTGPGIYCAACHGNTR